MEAIEKVLIIEMAHVWEDAYIRQHAIRSDYQGDSVGTTPR